MTEEDELMLRTREEWRHMNKTLDQYNAGEVPHEEYEVAWNAFADKARAVRAEIDNR